MYIIKTAVAPQFNYISMMILVTISDRVFHGKKPRNGLKKLVAS